MLSRFVFGFFGALLTFTQVSLSSTTPEIEEDRSVLQVVPYTFCSSSRGLSPVTKTDTPPFAILVRSRRTPLTIVAGDSLTVLISPSTLAVDREGYIRWCRELAPHMLWLAQFVFRGYNNDRAIIAYHQAAQWGEPNVQGEALMGLHQLLEDRKKKRALGRVPKKSNARLGEQFVSQGLEFYTANDFHNAAQLFQKAIILGNVEALYRMGILCTATGPEFLESDLNTALHYLKRAESQGHPKASQEIAIIQGMLASPNPDEEAWG